MACGNSMASLTRASTPGSTRCRRAGCTWRCRPCSRTSPRAPRRSRSSRHTRRRSRTCSCRSPGGTCAMSDLRGTPRAPRTWRDAQIVQLAAVRFREFIREPEALFWVFIFPVLLTAGLGLAFRGKPADTALVAVVEAPKHAGAGARALLSESKNVVVHAMTADSALEALRDGKVALIVAEDAAGSIVYRYDPARDESRTARLIADDALQHAAGRVEPIATTNDFVTALGS